MIDRDETAPDDGLTAKAGSDSPHLDESEKTQAAEHAAPRALVIHEVIREEGENELTRRPGALVWSGLAAGLSMGFSFLSLALIRASLPDEPWRRLLDSVGYTMGFLIVILGRQQLFTESTLTAVLPFLVRRDRATLLALVRFWAVVLSANLAGTLIFAALITPRGIFSDAVYQALVDTGREAVGGKFGSTFLRAVFAGWLVGLMVWLLPSARSARMFVIMFLTYVVAMGRLSHVIAGSVDSAYLVFSGNGSARDYVVGFLLPTLLGNTIGGVTLVAMLNHAPLAPELRPDGEAEAGGR
jgi:formate/nitrite transporter FocA (FNT family)